MLSNKLNLLSVTRDSFSADGLWPVPDAVAEWGPGAILLGALDDAIALGSSAAVSEAGAVLDACVVEEDAELAWSGTAARGV